jgi:hypothetical protein
MSDNKSKPTKHSPKAEPKQKKQILPVRPKGRVVNEERHVPPRKEKK